MRDAMDCKMMAAETEFRGFIAALVKVNVLHNPLGDGVHELIRVFEEKEQLRTLCGFEDGIETIDWAKSKKGPTEALLLAADVKASTATAAGPRLICVATWLTARRWMLYDLLRHKDVKLCGTSAANQHYCTV